MTNLYHETAESAAATPALDGDVQADVAIIGAGLTGLSTALHLAEQGARVSVLEAREPGWGASGRNGGQVNPGLKLDPDVVERDFGAELGARMNALAGGAPDFVFDLVRRYSIRCEARRSGTLRAAAHPKHAAQVRETARQWQRRGAPVELLEDEDIARATGARRYLAAMFDRRGGDLNPLSFTRGLARAALESGAQIHGCTRVLGLERSAGRWQARTAAGTVTAAQVVLATNGYTDDVWPDVRRSIVPLFGAIAATEPLPDSVAHDVMPTRSVLYESGAITVYYRVDCNRRLLFGGRGPMREVSDVRDIPHLLRYARKLWPVLSSTAWTHAWGGQLAMTEDHYPHVHEPQPGILLCLGYNGRGVALSTTLGAHLARRMANPGAPFDMPITNIKTLRLHALWPLGVRAAILRGRLTDFLGI